MSTVTLRRQGDTLGLTLPAETGRRMGFEDGQQLTLVELADGVMLVRRNPVLERQIEVAREVLRDQASVLRELAKR